jgi:hypothetical protein
MGGGMGGGMEKHFGISAFRIWADAERLFL